MRTALAFLYRCAQAGKHKSGSTGPRPRARPQSPCPAARALPSLHFRARPTGGAAAPGGQRGCRDSAAPAGGAVPRARGGRGDGGSAPPGRAGREALLHEPWGSRARCPAGQKGASPGSRAPEQVGVGLSFSEDHVCIDCLQDFIQKFARLQIFLLGKFSCV
ncbi:ribosomal large subunit pseudouridine synthase B-like isoform X2 [Parus major]|uniref:ribosomal large subunit pseudouridine synthase B-like isoform X2 n=1 Tax=Parus major TaxID=9157 RepID=UPI00077105F5|nr:ribosomal large subunit pseudouridine synthase B-like isoform X2 [Parus major]